MGREGGENRGDKGETRRIQGRGLERQVEEKGETRERQEGKEQLY